MTRKKPPATEEEIKEFIKIVRENPGMWIGDALMLINNNELNKLVDDGILEERKECFISKYYVKDD